MIKFFHRVKSSAFIAFIIIIVNLLSYFGNLRITLTNTLSQIGITNSTLSDVILILGFGIILMIFLFVIDIILERFFQTRLISLSYKTEPPVTFSSDASGERIHDFQILRAHAKKSIFVMGIGLTYFSADYSLLEDLLNKNIFIRVLMINPDIIFQTLSAKKYQDIGITSILFDDYFLRRGYSSEIRTSLNRLISFIEERKKMQGRLGRIELRVYPYFIPLNFTIADEKFDGEILLELPLPFSNHRIRLNFTDKSHGRTYTKIVADTEILWHKSTHILDDFN